MGLVVVSVLFVLALALSQPTTATARATAQPPTDAVAAPQVHTVITLPGANLHPGQLAYDRQRNGLWFWTSTQDRGVVFENRLYFYNIAHKRLQSWPLYSGDWSSQLLAGLAVAPNGDVWIGWNNNLVEFHPASDTSTRYVLPAQPRYPLSAAVLGDLPPNLGIADLAIAPDGEVWLARYGALSLTAFSSATHTFTEYPLPLIAGDPAKLALAPNGVIFFTTNLSADHPGYANERIGAFDPVSHHVTVYHQPARSLLVTPSGDVYTVLGSAQFGLSRLPFGAYGASRVGASSTSKPVFQHEQLPFAVDDAALAADAQGRVWVAVAGQPDIAVLYPAVDHYHLYQYAALSVAGHPVTPPFYVAPTAHARVPQPAPNAMWVTHIVAMVTDSQGHLWYVRAGSNSIEEVVA